MNLLAKFAALTAKAKAAFIAASVVIISTVAVVTGIALTKEDTYRVLKVFEMTGEAYVMRQGSGELDAYVGMNLESGDLLTVGDNSTLRISLDSDKYILLDSGTVLELIAEGTASDSRTTINLKKGCILNEISEPLSANSSYEVATPKATMAVRGTSFMVSVEEDGNGGYTINVSTLHGVVEAMLFDEDGNPTEKKALIPEQKCVIIRTEANKDSGNPAEIDGTSMFMILDEDGHLIPVSENMEPVMDLIYEYISANIAQTALRSNDTYVISLDEEVVRRLKGALSNDNVTSQTTAVTSEEISEKISQEIVSETINTEHSETTAEPAVTTVPVFEETIVTAVCETTVPLPDEPVTTSVCETTVSAGETTAQDTYIVQTTAPTEKTERETTTSNRYTTRPYTSTTNYTTPFTTPFTTSVTTSATTSDTTVTTVPTETSADSTITTADPEVFEVSFEADGAVVTTVSVNDGDTVTASDIPDVPSKTGHTGRWVYGADEQEFTSAVIITESMTVKALYTKLTYTISFAGETMETYNDVTAEYGTALSEILSGKAIKTVAGKDGIWSLTAGGTTELDVTKLIEELADPDTRKLTVYASHKTITYTVSFAGETMETYDDVTAEYGTALSEILSGKAIKTVAGKDGIWSLTAGSTTELDVTKLIEELADPDTRKLTIYAVNNPVAYTVTFEAVGFDVGETVPSDITVYYGDGLLEKVSGQAVPKKTGYTGVWTFNDAEITADMLVQDAADTDRKITVKASYSQYLELVVDNITTLELYMGEKVLDRLNAIESINADKIGNDLDDPQVWMGTDRDWYDTDSGYLIKLDDTHDVDEYVLGRGSVQVQLVQKTKITYNVGSETGFFYLYENDSLASVGQNAYLAGLLGEGYSEFVISGDDTFGIYTIAGQNDFTITAKPREFTVTYQAEGYTSGTVPSDETAEYGTLLKPLTDAHAVPKKTGNTGEWKIYAGGSYTDITEDTVVTEDVLIVAVYTQRDHVLVNLIYPGYTDDAPCEARLELDQGINDILDSYFVADTTGYDLDDPMIWTQNGSWNNLYSGSVTQYDIDNGMELTLKAVSKIPVNIYVDGVAQNIRYVPSGASFSECGVYSEAYFWDYVLGIPSDDMANYTTPVDGLGSVFTYETTVTAETSVYVETVDGTSLLGEDLLTEDAFISDPETVLPDVTEPIVTEPNITDPVTDPYTDTDPDTPPALSETDIDLPEDPEENDEEDIGE